MPGAVLNYDCMLHMHALSCSPDNQELETPITCVPHSLLAAHRQTLRVHGALNGLVNVAGQHIVAKQDVAGSLRSAEHTPEADGLIPENATHMGANTHAQCKQ